MNNTTNSTYNLPFVFSLLLLMTGFMSCGDDDRREREETNLRLDSLSTALEEQRRRADSLELLMQKGEVASEHNLFTERKYDTIDNPPEYIKQALREKPELIPAEAVLGGTMDYREIKILTDEWLLATYDDGHIQGKTIFRFEVQEDGSVEFSPLATRKPAEENREIPYE